MEAYKQKLCPNCYTLVSVPVDVDKEYLEAKEKLRRIKKLLGDRWHYSTNWRSTQDTRLLLQVIEILDNRA